MYWNDMVWWAWIPMMTGMILFWGFVAWVVIRLLSSQEAGRGPSERSARQILDARFARGEIGASDFQRARRPLEGEALTGDGSEGPGLDDADREDRPVTAV